MHCQWKMAWFWKEEAGGWLRSKKCSLSSFLYGLAAYGRVHISAVNGSHSVTVAQLSSWALTLSASLMLYRALERRRDSYFLTNYPRWWMWTPSETFLHTNSSFIYLLICFCSKVEPPLADSVAVIEMRSILLMPASSYFQDWAMKWKTHFTASVDCSDLWQ